MKVDFFSLAGIRSVILVLFIAVLTIVGGVEASPTTNVHIVKFSTDGNTMLAERSVDYQWLESHLPVMGDGRTHYYHQGPVFADNKSDQWDPMETKNFKDQGAVKGTDIRDLCELVGGMKPGDTVMVHAVDGYHLEFEYPNVYTPEPRQGPIVLCWYNGEDSEVGERQGVGYPPDYYTGMRLVFFADNSTNTRQEHVFGNFDMHEVMPNESIHLYENLYPSTNGYTAKWVDEVRIYDGGYHGPTDDPIQSLATGNPPATTASAPLIVTLLACGTLIALSRRGFR